MEKDLDTYLYNKYSYTQPYKHLSDVIILLNKNNDKWFIIFSYKDTFDYDYNFILFPINKNIINLLIKRINKLKLNIVWNIIKIKLIKNNEYYWYHNSFEHYEKDWYDTKFRIPNYDWNFHHSFNIWLKESTICNEVKNDFSIFYRTIYKELYNIILKESIHLRPIFLNKTSKPINYLFEKEIDLFFKTMYLL